MREREQIMLAYPFEDKRLEKWFNEVKQIYLQPKYEGDRCRALIDQRGKCTLFSSSARVLESVPHINKALESLGHTGVEFDGELYKHGMPHEEIRSRVSRTVGKHPQYEEIEYHIYDLALPLRQDTRILHLRSLLDNTKLFNSKGWPIRQSPTYPISTGIEVDIVYNVVLEQGYEGIILRHPYFQYERKRSTGMMKLKPRLSGIYKVVGYTEEHTIHGEPKQALGTLELKDDQGNLFEVGTGFTREQRETMWKQRVKLFDRLVKIRYQALTTYNIPKMASFETFVESERSET